jgi:hypothetical protein
MAPATVWVIGSDHWPRAYLRAELIERGLDAIGFVALRDALARLAVDRLRPALVIIDLHQQPATERGMSTLLAAGCPVIAIGGAAEWADPALRARPWALFLRRPVTIGGVADAAQRVLSELNY